MAGYIHGHHDSVLRSHRWRTVANSAAYLVPYLKPGMSLLDIGCGPASLTADLARQVAPGYVLGIDPASAILEEARAAVAGLANIEVREGDVYGLDMTDDAFDVVHAHQVLQHLTDPIAALAEMGRVARPDGLVAVRDADYRAMTWWPADPGLDRWMDLYQAVARANGTEPDAGRRLLAWAQEAGLSVVEANASVWCFSTPEDREWWGGLWAERVVASTLAEQARGQGLVTDKELGEISRAWRRWSTSPGGWFAVLHGEVIARPR